MAMSVNDGPKEDESKPEGKPQRPFATLDLTARDVSQPESAGAEASQAHEPASSNGAPPPRDHGGSDFPMAMALTSLASGALGAIIAFFIAYFAFGPSGSPDSLAKATDALRAEIAQSKQQLAGLQDQLRDAIAKTSGFAAVRAEADGLKKDLASLTERVSRSETSSPSSGAPPEAIEQAIAPLNAKITGIDGRLGDLAKAQGDVESRLKTIATTQSEADRRIADIAKAQSAVETNSKAAALSIALYNLRRAANEGKPFAAELKSVAAMSPVPLDLGPLEARRDLGLRSLDQLQTDFDTAANKAIDAENAPSDQSLSSELWSKVKSFVRIRRKGNVEGDTTRAILARVEQRLKTGDLQHAASEAEALKGPAAEALAPWLSETKAKIAANAALERAETKILTALGGEDQVKRGG
jgi:hypothetical protein